jgi:1-pyrroline-5-carboxylate dehydrogenase
MPKGFYNVPVAKNEPIKSYLPGSTEKKELKAALQEAKSKQVDIPMFIGGEEVRTEKQVAIHPPHELSHTLGHFHAGDATHVEQAIQAALNARESWAAMS